MHGGIPFLSHNSAISPILAHMKTTNSSTPIFVGALAIATIIGASAFVLTQSKDNARSITGNSATKETTSQTSDTATSTETPSTTTSTTQSTTASSNSNGYKDGSYSATASYSVPHGYSNDITVKLTLANGVVSAVTTDNSYSSSDRESGMYIDAFENAIESAVVGKSLDSLTSLGRVGGASLTTYAFDDAITTIANQAKA